MLRVTKSTWGDFREFYRKGNWAETRNRPRAAQHFSKIISRLFGLSYIGEVVKERMSGCQPPQHLRSDERVTSPVHLLLFMLQRLRQLRLKKKMPFSISKEQIL